MVEKVRLAVLMTCYNRMASTIQCLRMLKVQSISDVSISLFLVDDGSTDGTSKAVVEIYPEATVLAGNGDLYWCGGMHLAFGHAISEDFDFYLWLNDDTHLFPDAVVRLFETYHAASSRWGAASIIVGSTLDPDTGQFTYGGWRRRQRLVGPITWEKFPPNSDQVVQCETLNGNCVLIPRAVVKRVGNIDPVFRQGIGDLDYGLRAARRGCSILVAPGYYGECKSNDGSGLWSDRKLPLLMRWRKLLEPKGLPVKQWFVFSYRHKGRFWFLSCFAPYLLFWFKALQSSLKGRN